LSQPFVPASGDLRASVHVPSGGAFWSRLFVFLGPGYLVATGYMDPGNWATALAGGSKFGTALLFVAVLSSLMAIVLQSLAARLGLGSGLDLAQACRARFPRPVVVGLWLLAEAGIFATDLAEVIGTAIGLQLLFKLPLTIGVIVTLLDTFLVLAFERAGFRKIELFVIAHDGEAGFRRGGAGSDADQPILPRSGDALSGLGDSRRDGHAA
jgi:manganese transport protein